MKNKDNYSCRYFAHTTWQRRTYLLALVNIKVTVLRADQGGQIILRPL